MNPWRTLLQRHPALLAAVVLLALAMRVTVPAGFMPSIDTAGHATLIVCDGMTAPAAAPTMHHSGMTEHASPSGHHGHDGDKPTPSQPCGYAAAGLAFADFGPIDVAVARLAFRATADAIIPVALAPGRGLAAPPPPSHAPPAFA